MDSSINFSMKEIDGDKAFMKKIRIGIVGYGNLGRGVQYAAEQNKDVEVVAVFTRRDPSQVNTVLPVKVERYEAMADYADKIDVMILCGGSATDLPEQSSAIVKMFNTVDSFDTHARIPEYFAKLDSAAKETGHLGAMSIGWDPGLFSLARLYFGSALAEGSTYTFWGKGVSQGHSDAIRRINGVKDAKQYTVPVASALERVRAGENPVLTVREKHTRECYVVAEEGADLSRIEKEIKEMPNYFADYDTTVHFISEEELKEKHSGIPHGGMVLRSGTSYTGNHFLMEFSLKLDSNPEFTSSVLLAYARAVYRLHAEGRTGAVTVFDIAPKYLSPMTEADQRKELL